MEPQLRLESPSLEARSRFDDREVDAYVAFEDVFYDHEVVKALLGQYLPLFDGIAPQEAVVDLGVGRGEFLEMLLGAGLNASGCEINEVEFRVLKGRGLPVTLQDAKAYLGAFPDGSIAAVTAIQVVEHLQPDYLVSLLELVGRKIQAGGLVLLETPNMLNWAVQQNFWLDLTHVRPYPPETLQFLLQRAGIRRFEKLYSAPVPPEGGPDADAKVNYGNVALLGFK